MRTDPFRELDRLTHVLWGTTGTRSQPAIMPMDAYRQDGQFIVRAERKPSYGEDVELQAAERPRGVFSRQLFLGDTLDTERIEAGYEAGVLTLRIPVAEKAKARKIEIIRAGTPEEINV